MISETDITFVITCFKSSSLIKKTLKNLPDRTKKIIIENSGDKKIKELENQYSNLKCFIMDKNIGFGAANNIGINNSNTKFIFILNPDVILKKNDLANILKQCANLDFSILGFVSKTEKYNFQKNKKFLKVNEVKGFAMLIKKKDIYKCLFDENFFLYLEEIDLCRRVKNNGGNIFILDYELDHLGGKSHDSNFLELEKSRNWHWMWSKFYFKKKYFGYPVAFIIFLPLLLLLLFKFFLYFKNYNKKEIYKYKFLGLLHSIKGDASFYRPKI